MHELPPHTPASNRAIGADTVAGLAEPAELFDVDVDQLSRMLALIADHRLSRLQVLEPAQARGSKHSAHRGRRDLDLPGDLLAREALATQRDDLLNLPRRCRPVELVRSRGAILQTGGTLRNEPRHPLVSRLDVHPEGRGHRPVSYTHLR